VTRGTLSRHCRSQFPLSNESIGQTKRRSSHEMTAMAKGWTEGSGAGGEDEGDGLDSFLIQVNYL
jgi:hypothetical protein